MVETKCSAEVEDGVLTEETRTEENARSSVSVEERIRLNVERVFTSVPLAPGEDSIDIDSIYATASDGFSATSSIIDEVSSTVSVAAGAGIWDHLETAVTVLDKFSKIYAGGKAAIDFINFIRNHGKPSEFDQIMSKLNEISLTLRKIQTAVEQGFADLIAHSDFVSFRSKVDEPTLTIFDEFVRCFMVPGEDSIKDFKKDLEEKFIPRQILSTIYTFLDPTNNNIITTHLKAEKYQYSTYKTWVARIFHQASLLVIVNVFYLGLKTGEAAEEEKEKMETFAKNEINFLFGQLARMSDKLNEIELERLKLFHSTEVGKEWIKKVIDKIKPPTPDRNVLLPKEFLPNLAKDFKEKWKEFNGPLDFYVNIFRGRVPLSGEKEFNYRHAGFYIGNNERVTVAQNVAYQTGLAVWNQDAISVALIQPLTNEIFEANKYREETETKLYKIITDARWKDYVIAETKDKICELQSKKPLLITYNADFYQYRSKQGPDVQRLEEALEDVGEASSAKSMPFPTKYEWIRDYNIRRIVQVVFQHL